MPFTPSSKHTLALWWLLSVEGEGFVDSIRPELSMLDRKSLESAGLIRVEKRSRSAGGAKRMTAAMYALLTDAGWRWANDNLDAEFSVRSPASAPVLRRIFGKLKSHLSRTGCSLAEFIAVPSLDPPAQADRHDEPADPETDSAMVLRACRQRTEGNLGVRILLSEIRQQLPEIPRDRVDAALCSLETAGTIVLYPFDNPQEIRPADEAAAIPNSAGQPRHILYLRSLT